MKKKLLSILAVAAVSAVALVGCGGDDHTHNYKWKFEGDKHWQECSCGDKKGEADHVDEKINATGAAGKDELCDVCGANLHEHAYQWNSTALVHWQECECGDKTEEVAHVDEKNNETDAEGADELCDECGRGFYAVTFNLGGHGTVATQYIGKDGKVAQPEKPADDDSYKFKGWYKDAAHTTAYNFETETITSATEIFAWFEDDDTAGASKKYAHELELDSLLGNPQKAKKNEVVYYSFTATESGRYMLSLGTGVNNENATFTTSVTDDTVFGKDCAADEIAVDVDEGDTVYILFKYLGEEGDGVNVSPVVSTVTDEELPAGIFKDGTYTNGDISLVFTNEGKAVQFTDASGTEDNFIAKYLGGKYQSLTFIKSSTDEKYTLTSNADGTYKLKLSGSSSREYKLFYLEDQKPVALVDIAGYYKPKGDAYNSIVELYIYKSDNESATKVLYKEDGVGPWGRVVNYSDLKDGIYNTDKNTLKVDGGFFAMLKLGADGETVEALMLGGKEYVKDGEVGKAPPSALPLGESVEYNGVSHTIHTGFGGSQYFGTGANGITVIDYNETKGLYTIAVLTGFEGSVHYLKVSADYKTITLCESDGEKAIDTLSLFEWVYHDLPTTEETLNIAAADYQKNLYVLVANQAGWYNITANAGAVVYYPLSSYDLLVFDDCRTAQGSIYLNEGDCVGVYLSVPAATTVTVAHVTSPAGYSSENPKALVDGKATLDVAVDLESEDTQYAYFTYTALEAGTYAVKATYGNMNSALESGITVNGEEGYVGYYNPAVYIELTDDLTVNIAIPLSSDWDYITVSVAEDITIDAVQIELEGTPANDVLTVTKNAFTDVNYLVYTKGAPITVTGSAAFSVKLQDGTVVAAEENEGSYIAVVPAYVETDDGDLTKVYFRIVSESEEITLTLSQTHAKGSEGYPLEIELTDGAAELEVEIGVQNAKYFVLTPGTYSLSSSINQLRVILNGDDFLSFEAPFEVKEGDVLMCVLYYSQDTATLTITEVVEVFTADQVGTYEGHGSVDFFGETYDYDLKLSFNKFGVGTYWVDDQDYDIAIKDNGDGTYSFTYDDSFEVTFTFDDGVLKLTDEDKSDDVVTTEKAAVSIDGVYSGDINDTPSQIIISGDGTKVTYISDGEKLASNATLVYDKDKDEYSFTYMFEMYTVTMKITGDTMDVVDDIFEGTLIKE